MAKEAAIAKYDNARFIPANPSVAQDELRRLSNGNIVTLGKDDKEITLRILPPYKVSDGRAYWFSMSDIHFSVPVPNPPDQRDTITHFCPRSGGMRCLTCENEETLRSMNVWGGSGVMGCRPTRKVRFNAFSYDTPERGVFVFQDGLSTLRAVNDLLESEKHLLDPLAGGFVRIKKVDSSPWRRVDVPRDGWVSIDAVDGADIEWAYPENLIDLEASWDYPTLEQQSEWWGMVAKGPVVEVRPTAVTKVKGAPEDDDLFDGLLEDEDDD